MNEDAEKHEHSKHSGDGTGGECSSDESHASTSDHSDSQDADPDRGFDSGPLEFGCILDGKGGARRIDWAEAKAWRPGEKGEILWTHLRRTNKEARKWIEDDEAVPERTTDLLLSTDSTPTAFSDQDTLVAVLRGVGSLRESNPDNLILVQIWSNGRSLITLREHAKVTPKDVMNDFRDGKGPTDAGSLFTWLVRKTIDGMGTAIIELDDEIDQLDRLDMQQADPNKLLTRISNIRRDCLALQRHMGPQHHALQKIADRAPDWFEDNDREAILETIHQLRRYLVDIEVSKESVSNLMDELNARSAARTRFTSMIISILSTIFLPLTFITGLWGTNVGGIPGAKGDHAFAILTAFCALIFAAQVWLIMKMHVVPKQ